jgi:hypothetical protein
MYTLPVSNKFLVILLLAAFTTGCADVMKIQEMSSEIASGDPYPQDDPSKDVKLVAFEKDSVSMGIPIGWKSVPVTIDGDLQLKFSSDSGSSLLVFCHGAFMHRDTMQQILQEAAKAAIPNAVKVAGMYELEVPGINPRFELYRGSSMAKGIPVGLDANIAWRVNSRLSGCKYGLIYIAPSSDSKNNEYEFLSIVRSLK